LIQPGPRCIIVAMGGTGTEQVPVSAVDPFSDGFLADSFRRHGELREAGPVVWLERYGVWAMARYAEVHEALRDHATYCSLAGPPRRRLNNTLSGFAALPLSLRP
jgi:cytochrome P450